MAGGAVEHAGQCRTALQASTAVVDLRVGNRIARPLDQPLTAASAIGAGAQGVIDIADIDMLEPARARNVIGANEGGVRRVRLVAQLVVGVKRREVQRHVGSQMLEHPCGERPQLGLGVVINTTEQRGYL